MRLLLHIAAGTVVGWVVIEATQQMLVANGARSVAESRPKFPPVTFQQPRPTPKELPRVVIQQPRTPNASLGQQAVVDLDVQR